MADAEPRASRVCWALADGACWGLVAELCRRNGLPLTGFMSLTDDIKVEILKRLAGADDLARMERTCKDLRRLVAERDGEVWKPMYDEALRAQLGWRRRGRWWGFSFLLRSESSDSESEEVEVLSWKEKFMEARQRVQDKSFWRRMLFRSLSPFPPSHCTELSSCLLDWLLDPPEQDTVSTRARGKITAGHRRKVPRTRNVHKKKWAGAGAIHSPSSRYQWKHR